ncbi:MAG TPA: energy transducer TonB [Methylophilaceae bacterium]|jgi:colicin import membrane protein
MIRAHENPLALRAGALSILVHIVLVAILLLSFNWKAVQPANVAQVELWDSLPTLQPVIEPTPLPPEPPKPEPVIKEEPKPEPPPEPKAEIEIKKKPPVEVKPKIEKPKPEEKPKPDPAVKAKEEEKKRQDQLKKLQQMLAEEDKNMQHEQQKKDAQASTQEHAAQSAAAAKGEVDKYIGLVSSKIRPYVNKQLCGSGKPELTYEISLLPTGEISGSPKLIKGSGITACDDAVDRAIRQANPLPKPSAEILGQVRDLILKFRPNDDN